MRYCCALYYEEKRINGRNELFERLPTSVECYDPQTKAWSFCTPMEQVRMVFDAFLGHDGKIYLVGGLAGYVMDPAAPYLDTIDIYDPATDTWSQGRPMPAGREGHATVMAADGRIYVLGGSASMNGPPLRDVFIYDPRTDAWSKGPDLRVRRANVAAVATPDGKIYVIGGTDVGAFEFRSTMNRFLPKERRFYAGKVQDTVEVLDVFTLR